MSPIGLLVLSAAALGPRYPIAPVPLHVLVERSDVIAVVRPGPDVVEATADPFAITTETTPLEVLRVLKGSPGDTARESHTPYVACPRPPRYPEGERVLAFLWLREDGTYGTVGLSYGTKALDEARRAVYAERIAELLALQAARPGTWRESPEFLDWIVRCAESPVTRWEGAYVLDPGLDPLGLDPVSPPPALSGRLDAPRRKRLLDALLATDEIGAGELCLLRVLRGRDDPRLDAFVLERMSDAEREPDWVLVTLMEQMAERWDDERVRAMASEYEGARFTREPRPEMDAILRRFLQHAAARR